MKKHRRSCKNECFVQNHLLAKGIELLVSFVTTLVYEHTVQLFANMQGLLGDCLCSQLLYLQMSNYNLGADYMRS